LSEGLRRWFWHRDRKQTLPRVDFVVWTPEDKSSIESIGVEVVWVVSNAIGLMSRPGSGTLNNGRRKSDLPRYPTAYGFGIEIESKRYPASILSSGHRKTSRPSNPLGSKWYGVVSSAIGLMSRPGSGTLNNGQLFYTCLGIRPPKVRKAIWKNCTYILLLFINHYYYCHY
jgi:hypothetical protein